MQYVIKAHSTKYNGIWFRSRLEARWACFFDLLELEWMYEPIDINGWTPDFSIKFPCKHSECNGSHILLVEVKPYFNIEDFYGHPCMDYAFGGFSIEAGGKGEIPADASAAFGINPTITFWEMCHGWGGGCYSIYDWFGGNIDIEAMWKQAGNIVQWIKD